MLETIFERIMRREVLISPGGCETSPGSCRSRAPEPGCGRDKDLDHAHAARDLADETGDRTVVADTLGTIAWWVVRFITRSGPHCGAAQGGNKIARDNRWAVAGIVVRLPFRTPWCACRSLFRLWAGKGTASSVELREFCRASPGGVVSRLVLIRAPP